MVAVVAVAVTIVITHRGQASQPMHAALGAVPGVGASEEVVKFQRNRAFGAFP